MEANRRANEARAARDKANIKDATEFMYEVGKIAEVEQWKKERPAQLRAQVDAEAAKKVAGHRTKAGAAVARMQDRGETLTTIAENTDVGIGIVRTMLRHAPKNEKAALGGRSHALGVGDVTTDPPPGRSDGEPDSPQAASA